jgi:CysZ protein
MTPPFDPPRRGRFSQFWWGLTLPVEALRLIFHTARLRRLSLWGAALTFCGLVLAFVGSWEVAGWILERLSFGRSYEIAAGALRLLLFSILALVGALTVPNVLVAPLQDSMSEATDWALGASSASTPATLKSFVISTLVAWRQTLSRLVVVLAGLAVLLPLNMIPAVGSVLWSFGASAWVAYWTAVEHVSTPASRHLLSFSEVTRTIRQVPFVALGLGLALSLLLCFPIVNALLVPVGVVSGTVCFHALRRAGAWKGTAQTSQSV